MGRKTLKLQQERANKIQEFTSILQSHCVASYVSKCIEGKCHIFSIYNNIIYERATIEVGKKIIQIRGKFNAAPSKSCLQAIRDWAMRYQLTKSGYINW
jgi:hypothetical protein